MGPLAYQRNTPFKAIRIKNINPTCATVSHAYTRLLIRVAILNTCVSMLEIFQTPETRRGHAEMLH